MASTQSPWSQVSSGQAEIKVNQNWTKNNEQFCPYKLYERQKDKHLISENVGGKKRR